jgi:undecaprenyl phosphate-alpha-L-ara4N flippase subunit ArnE
MVLCSFCFCGGQLVWKLMPNFNLPFIIGGFVIFGVGALFMIAAYRFGELSVLQPINSLSYIYSLALGYIIFREDIDLFKIIGVVIILSGVIVLARGSST